MKMKEQYFLETKQVGNMPERAKRISEMNFYMCV